MHELATTRNLIALTIEECKKNRVFAPKRITTELGKLTTYKKEPIEYYFKLLKAETKILETTKVILALGKIAFDAYCNVCNIKRLKFGHNKIYSIYDKTLIASYHPSRRNTNTRTLTWQMWIDVFKTARLIIDRQAELDEKYD